MLAIGGAAYYLLQQPAPRAQAQHDLQVVKDKASSLVGAAENKLEVDTRSLGQKARDFETNERNRAGSKLDPALGGVVQAGADAKNEVKSWFGAETEAEKAKRKAEEAAKDVKQEVRRLSGKSFVLI